MRIGRVVIVGGSGMVGQVLLGVIQRHDLRPSELIICGRSSVGKSIQTVLGEVIVQDLSAEVFVDAELVFMSAGASVSREWIPKILAANHSCRVIDLSSAFRYDDSVPLVIPAINADAIGDSRLIACPNCTTSIALMALTPIHRRWNIRRVDLASYQAASGAGMQALNDLQTQINDWAASGKPTVTGNTSSTPHPLGGNLIPRIDVAEPAWDGFTKEEMKTAWESTKILFGEPIPFYATCVRVPVQRCHSEVLTIAVQKRVAVEAIRELLKESFGVVVLDDVASHVYPMPLNMEGREEVGVGRIRVTPEGDILLWVCGDQLLRGAALTAVEIAEVLYQ